jgi:hypothetical protein
LCGEGPRSRSYGRWRERWSVFSFFQVMEPWWNEIDRGKVKYLGKTCPSSTLFTTNPTRADPRSKPGLRGGRPETNRLSRGTASTLFCYFSLIWEENLDIRFQERD